jgi:hypothetical protein
MQRPLLLLGVLVGSMAAPRASAEDPLEGLNNIWKAQRSEIVSAKIRCRMVRTSDVKPLTVEELEKSIEGVNLAAKPDDLRVVLGKLLSKPVDGQAVLWGVREMIYDGAKSKEVPVSGGGATLATDGQHVVERTDYNKRVYVSIPGVPRQHMTSLSEFRFVPDERLRLKLAGNVAGRLKLEQETENGRTVLLVDRDSGAVHECISYMANGHPARCLLQSQFAVYPGGATFPLLVVDGAFGMGGKLRWMSLTAIEDAEFNVQVPEGAFKVAVPPGTVMVDQRGAAVVTFNSPAGADDAVEHADEWLRKHGVKPPDGESRGFFGRYKWYVIGSAVVAVLGLAALAVFRRWSRRPRLQLPAQPDGAGPAAP